VAEKVELLLIESGMLLKVTVIFSDQYHHCTRIVTRRCVPTIYLKKTLIGA
jgi:hypothetical protein